MTEAPETSADPIPNVVIIGAGPAGLTAAYELAVRHGITSTVLESDSVVGGISRTVERDGWRFDIGGHRFFTMVTPVDDLWFEILGAGTGRDAPVLPREAIEAAAAARREGGSS